MGPNGVVVLEVELVGRDDVGRPVWNSNFGRPTPSMRCCLRSCVCSMAWSVRAIDATLPPWPRRLDGVEISRRSNLTHWLIFHTGRRPRHEKPLPGLHALLQRRHGRRARPQGRRSLVRRGRLGRRRGDGRAHEGRPGARGGPRRVRVRSARASALCSPRSPPL